MNFEELEAKKQELIERVEGWLFAGEEAKAQQALIIKLLKGTDCTDPDFKEALEDETAESIISLDMDCYDLAGFVKWLAGHDFDLFVDYRYADKVALSDVIQEVETSGESPACCYNFDIEEFKKLPDAIAKGDYIKECFDGLLYSDNMLVISW